MARALKDVDAVAVLNGTIINNLCFADDIAATAESQDDLQMIVDNILLKCNKMGMKVNIERTEVQCTEPHNIQMSMKIENVTLNQKQNLVYLERNISEDASIEADIKRRMGLACGVMQKLNPV